MKFALVVAALFTLRAGESTSGESIYRGSKSIKGRMAGSEDYLAPAATRCANCHGANGRGVAEAGVSGADIRGATLRNSTPRRGGPPAAYTLESFRTALRSGHDPAGVVLARAMPRYEISASDSAALWGFLLTLQ